MASYSSQSLDHLGLVSGMCKEIGVSKIIDHALGRCLDQLYETGVSDLYQCLSASVVKHLKLPCDGLNLDSTGFHLDGETSMKRIQKPFTSRVVIAVTTAPS